ncbi:MAG: formate dehydrogenase accessory sulfurtransferase FdhD [Chloroflexia bacterium]
MPSEAERSNAVVRHTALQVRPEGAGAVETAVPVERPLTVEVNGRPVAVLMSLPGWERELAVGFCLSEGWVASFPDILVVHYCRDEPARPSESPGAVVRLQVRPKGVRETARGLRRVLSGCGSVEVDLEALELPALPGDEAPWLPPEAILRMAAHLRTLPGVYRRAGAVHGAGLYAADGTPLVAAEDIGRHNALDKVLGAALIRGLRLSDRVVLTTGRASHEMVAKALRLGVPVVGSLSAPTSLAVALAERGRCTLIGRLRRETFLIYAGAGRIQVQEN